MERQILSDVIQFASCTFLLLAALIWVRQSKNRSRIYFSVAYAVCGIDLFWRIFDIYNGTPLVFQALQPGYLYMALIEIPLFLFCLIEIVNPGWLTWRKIGLLCSPWLLWNICLLISGFHFRPLETSRDIFLHIGEADVWLRLLFVLMILPYNILIYLIPYNWQRSSADQNLIRFYGAGFIVMALFFVASSVSGSMLVSSLHLLYGMIYCFYLAYYEIFLRLSVPREKTGEEDDSLRPIVIVPFPDASTGDGETAGEGMIPAADTPGDELWKSLTARMKKEKLWRNPDMSLVDLAGLLNTNRTTLSSLFKEHGYTGRYREYINRHRINDFLEIMERYPRRNIQETFFEVGYRSRMTAFRNFREYVGESPSGYFADQSEEI